MLDEGQLPVSTNLNSTIKICRLPQNRANEIGYWTVAFSTSRVARILQRGEGMIFWKFDTTVNELDPNFH